MNDNTGVQFKVGVFVVIGAGLLALLILNFSKGTTLFNTTYKLTLVLPNAAGLKPTADVMMAGLAIGKVTSMELAEDERSVTIKLSIVSKYKIRKDARFTIEALGFLGDQYISVSVPDAGSTTPDEIGYLQNGETVHGEGAYNVLAVVQSVSGLIDQAKKTVKDLDQSITNINASALSTNTLAHFVLAVSNLDVVSGKAVGAVGEARDLLAANSGSLTATISNFQALSASLTNTALQLNEIVGTNRADVRRTIDNLTVASGKFKDIASELQAGKGTLGSLLKNDQMSAQLASFVSNANNMTAQFGEFGQHLNQRGIWAMLWRPKHTETNASDKK